MPSVTETCVLQMKRVGRLADAPGAKYNSDTGTMEAPSAIQGIRRYLQSDGRAKTLGMVRDTVEFAHDLVHTRLRDDDDLSRLIAVFEAAVTGCVASMRLYEADAEYCARMEIHKCAIERLVERLRGEPPAPVSAKKRGGGSSGK